MDLTTVDRDVLIAIIAELQAVIERLQRRISRFSRSCGLLDHSFYQWCPASIILAGWRQSVLSVHLLCQTPLLGRMGPVAGDVKL